MFLDEGYMEVPSHTFVRDAPQPERVNDVVGSSSASLEAYVDFQTACLRVEERKNRRESGAWRKKGAKKRVGPGEVDFGWK